MTIYNNIFHTGKRAVKRMSQYANPKDPFANLGAAVNYINPLKIGGPTESVDNVKNQLSICQEENTQLKEDVEQYQNTIKELKKSNKSKTKSNVKPKSKPKTKTNKTKKNKTKAKKTVTESNKPRKPKKPRKKTNTALKGLNN